MYAAISAAATGATVVAAQTGKAIRVFNYTIVVDGAVTVTFASNTTAISGAMSFAANGGASVNDGGVGLGGNGLFQTNPGEALKLTLGGSVGVRGHLCYEYI